MRNTNTAYEEFLTAIPLCMSILLLSTEERIEQTEKCWKCCVSLSSSDGKRRRSSTCNGYLLLGINN